MTEHPRPGNFDTAATAWLAGRAVLALALLIGFYVFALTIVAGLLWVPYAAIRYLPRMQLVGAAWTVLKLAAVCLGAAATIVWALVPRRDHFEPPGPRLDSAAHPKLFAVVREIAAATGERQPDDVYLVNDENAWVAERGGVLGWVVDE